MEATRLVVAAVLVTGLVLGVSSLPVHEAETGGHDLDFVLNNLTALWEEVRDIREEVAHHLHHGHGDPFQQVFQQMNTMKHEHDVHHLYHPDDHHNDHHDPGLLQHLEEDHSHSGHDHGHDHSHSGHDHGHDHAHDHGHDHAHDHAHDHGHDHSDHDHSDHDHSDHDHGHDHSGHDHDHDHSDHDHGHDHSNHSHSHSHDHDHGHDHSKHHHSSRGRSGHDHSGHDHSRGRCKHCGHGRSGHDHSNHDRSGEDNQSIEEDDNHSGEDHDHPGHDHSRGSHDHSGGSHHHHHHHHHHGSADVHDRHDFHDRDGGHHKEVEVALGPGRPVLPPRLGLALIPGRGGGVQQEQEQDPWEHASCKVLPNADLPGSNVNGTVILSRKKDNSGPVYFVINLSGFDISNGRMHGFHIHENPLIGNRCGTAGGHLNPFGVTHGSPDSTHRHVGDLGNIEVDHEGKLTDYVITDDTVAFQGDAGIVGKSIVIHAGEDDLGHGGDAGSLASGNAGDRLACCTIHIQAGVHFRFKG